MEKLNNYRKRLNEISELIYILEDQHVEKQRENAAVILGIIYSAANLEAEARIQLKKIINS